MKENESPAPTQPATPISESQDLSEKMTGLINEKIKNGVPPPQVISLMSYIMHDLITRDLAIQRMNHMKASTVVGEALDAQPKGNIWQTNNELPM